MNERKVKKGHNLVRFDQKFAAERFPDDSIKSARKFCRNPDGDLGGPWCYVRIEGSNVVEKEYCDVTFCDNMNCAFVTNRSSDWSSSHFNHFKNDIEFKFSLRFWNSDDYLLANQARIVLSQYPLSTIEQDFVTISISNNYTSK